MKKAAIISVILLACNNTSISQGIRIQYQWPGFVRINDSVFISNSEVSIRDYAEFLTFMPRYFGSYSRLYFSIPQANSINWIAYSSSAKVIVPVTNLFDEPDTVNVMYVDKKGKKHSRGIISYSSVTHDFPVVNITKDQALLYCEFASLAYRDLLRNTKGKKNWKLPPKVSFRLPTENEWKFAANAGLDTAKYLYGCNDSIQPIAGTLVCKELYDSLNTGASIPVSVRYGFSNNLGVFNMCGNVAEIVMDSPYAFGGSFRELKSACTVLSRRDASVPADNIGFRVVAVISK